MKKKVLALCLSLFMLTGLVACKSNNDSQSTGTKENQAQNTKEEQVTEGAQKEKTTQEEELEDVTITVYMPSSSENAMTAGIQDDPVAQYIKEKTGVTLDVVIQDDDKTKAMIASGDLYDLNVIGSVDYAKPLIMTKAIADLTDYMQYAPEITKNFPAIVKYSQKYLSAGTDSIYVLPSRANSVSTGDYGDGNYIRWDYYVEAGSPEINSVDDWINLMETIQKNHPKTESGKKTYAVSLWTDWGICTYNCGTPLRKYLGYDTASNFDNVTLADMQYHDLYDDENSYIKFAKAFYELNQRGCLDPESFVQKYENYVNKLNEGVVLSAYANWQIVDINNILAKEDTGFVDIPFADTKEFPAVVSDIAPLGYTQRMFVISSKCDESKMKAIMRLLNFVYSEEGSRVIRSGAKGDTWTDESGKASLTDATIAAIQADAGYLNTKGADKYLGIIGRDYGALDSNGIPLALANSTAIKSQTLKTYEKKYCEHYGLELPVDINKNRKNYTLINEATRSLQAGEMPTDISRIGSKMDDYMAQAIPKLIMSEDEAAFDAKLAQIRKDIKEIGYDKYRDYTKESYMKAVEEYKAMEAK